MVTPLPRRRICVSRFGRCGRISAFLALPRMVRLFLSLKTSLTHFLHYLKLFRPPTIVWASLGADLRIFFRLVGIFAFLLLQLHFNHAGLFISHRNILLLQIPRFFTRLWWVFLLLWTLFTKSFPPPSTLKSRLFSSFRPNSGWSVWLI